jgi:hypothetical protein
MRYAETPKNQKKKILSTQTVNPSIFALRPASCTCFTFRICLRPASQLRSCDAAHVLALRSEYVNVSYTPRVVRRDDPSILARY